MTTTNRLSAALAAAAIAIGVGGHAFGQADNTNSVIAPANPNSSQRYQDYDSSRYPYDYAPRHQYDTPRQAYLDDAARRWDALHGYHEVPPAYVIERPYVEPYPRDGLYPRERSRLRIGGPGLAIGEDSNPNDYATGIYNPKP
jgi:hypothetical protein